MENLLTYAGGGESDDDILEERIKAQEEEKRNKVLKEGIGLNSVEGFMDYEDCDDEYEEAHERRTKEQEEAKIWLASQLPRDDESHILQSHINIQQKREDKPEVERQAVSEFQNVVCQAYAEQLARQVIPS